MKYSHLLFILVSGFFLASCRKVTSAEDLKKIAEMEGRVNDIRNHPPANSADIDLFPFKELAIAYIDFADKFPDAPECPDLLFKAGELYSQELNNLPRAIELFTRDYTEFPQHETAPHALFLKAYLYNNTLRDYVKAEKFYKEFLEKFPNHELAKSARFEIEQMGVPPEELLKRLQENMVNPPSDSAQKPVN